MEFFMGSILIKEKSLNFCSFLEVLSFFFTKSLEKIKTCFLDVIGQSVHSSSALINAFCLYLDLRWKPCVLFLIIENFEVFEKIRFLNNVLTKGFHPLPTQRVFRPCTILRYPFLADGT